MIIKFDIINSHYKLLSLHNSPPVARAAPVNAAAADNKQSKERDEDEIYPYF